jgi:hypothetical protein
VGKCAEIDGLLQFQSASDCWVGFEGLVRPRSFLLGEFVEIDTLIQPKSRAIEFRKLPIGQFRIGPFLVFSFTTRVERPSLRKFAIRRCTLI